MHMDLSGAKQGIGEAGWRSLPRSVWALGIVSLFMDTSSELVHGLLPAFLVTVLGAGAISVGLIEGVAEATPSISKVFSGAISGYSAGESLSWCWATGSRP
jgi:hypothetical protein